MSTYNFSIEQANVISEIQKYYVALPDYKRPVKFSGISMNCVIQMQETTQKFFNYMSYHKYVDGLLNLLRHWYFEHTNNDVVAFENKDQYELPETLTLNREDADTVFYLVQCVVKYIGEMNFQNERFERSSQDTVDLKKYKS